MIGRIVVTAVVDAVDRLFQVHLAGGSRIVLTPPVVEPEGHVGRLLHFGNLQAAAAGVYRSGRNMEKFPGLGGIDVEEVRRRAVLAFFVKLRRARIAFEAHIDAGVRTGLHDVPALVFSVLVVTLGGDCIVRMRLHGEQLLHVQQLDQQRELQLVRVEHIVAHQVAQVGFEQVGEAVLGKKTVFHHRFLPLAHGGDDPGFSAPYAILLNGDEGQGIEFSFHRASGLGRCLRSSQSERNSHAAAPA